MAEYEAENVRRSVGPNVEGAISNSHDSMLEYTVDGSTDEEPSAHAAVGNIAAVNATDAAT